MQDFADYESHRLSGKREGKSLQNVNVAESMQLYLC